MSAWSKSLILFSLFFSSFSFAKELNPLARTFSGFYAGASVGAINNLFTFRDNAGHITDPGEVSPLIQIFGGYGLRALDYYYIGAEAYAADTIGDAASNINTLDGGGPGTHVRNQTCESYGLSLLPGLFLNESVLGYGRLGVVWTKFNSSVTSPTASNTSHDREAGGELGVGLRTKLALHWDLRLEYSATFYRFFTTTVNNYRIRTLSNKANLGILYNFG